MTRREAIVAQSVFIASCALPRLGLDESRQEVGGLTRLVRGHYL